MPARKTAPNKKTAKKKRSPKAAQLPAFVPGLELCEGFFHDVVEPLMQEHFPGLPYSAGLVGHGSDVLGFDSATSMDHNWGPHVDFFLSPLDYLANWRQIDLMLRTKLPYEYRGFPTHFEKGDKYLKDKPKHKSSGKVNHLCLFWTPQMFFQHYLGYDLAARPHPSYRDWLLFPQQSLVEITRGKLFHDDLNVQGLRDRFAYYPDDVWRYMLRTQWGKILDELQTQARNGESGDLLGSQVVAARMVQKFMFLCFLQERVYVPYSKWFGTAFEKWLKAGPKLGDCFREILTTRDWRRRQVLIAKAMQALGRRQNALKLTKPVSTRITTFFGRDYPIVDPWNFVEAIEKSIKHPLLRDMKFPLGAIDQFIDHARLNQLEHFYTNLTEAIQ